VVHRAYISIQAMVEQVGSSGMWCKTIGN
jgi:hypothetical protein